MSKRKPLTKKQACVIHFKKRVRERYRFSCNKDRIRNIISKAEKAKKIDISCNRFIFMYDFNNIIIPVVFDRKRNCPVTALYIDDVKAIQERSIKIKKERHLLEEGRYDLLE